MKKTKQILTLLLCAALMLMLLASCGTEPETSDESTEIIEIIESGESNDPSNTSGDNSDESGQTGTDVSGDQSDVSGGTKVTKKNATSGGSDSGDPYDGISKYRGKTVKFATWIAHDQGEGAVPIASFNRKYGIKVQLVAVPEGSYTTKLSALIASGSSPDMIVDNLVFPNLLPLSMDLRTVSSINLNDPFWDAGVTEYSTFNGKTYGINSVSSPWTYRFMCFYNTKLFEENGFKSPSQYYKENNWNLETFEKCASQIAGLGSDYIGASVRKEFSAGIFKTEVTRLKNGKYVNNTKDPNLSKAWKWMLQGKEKGSFTTDGALDKFLKNKCGMFLYGDFGLRTTGGMETMDADLIGYVPMPKANKTDKYYPSVASWRSYGICKGAKNAEAAGYFIRYFLDFDNYDRSTMFKSKRASDFYDELRRIEDSTFMLTYYGVVGRDAAIFNEITQTTSAQIDTKLKAISNTVDDGVAKANALIAGLK